MVDGNYATPHRSANGARRIKMEISELIESLKEFDNLRKEVETLRGEVETLRKENEELKGKEKEEELKKEEEETLKEIDAFLENLKESGADEDFISFLRERAKPNPKEFLKKMETAQNILYEEGLIDIWNKVVERWGISKVMDVIEYISNEGNAVTLHGSLTDMWLDNHDKRDIIIDEDYESYVNWDAIAEDAYTDYDYIGCGDGSYILLEDVL